jgi:Cysteine-rich CPCC
LTPSKAACPCCGYRTLATRGTQEVCPVCLWEDHLPDGLDDDELDPEDAHNANGLCLFDARANLAAWDAIRPDLVHRSRPPRPDEAPEGTSLPAERPYDRWLTLEVGLGVHVGWIGPPPEDEDIRDGFLVLDDGRRAGLHVRAVPHALAPRIEPDDPGPGRNGQFEVWIPGRETDTDGVLAVLGAGLAAQIVALLGDGRAAARGRRGDSSWRASRAPAPVGTGRPAGRPPPTTSTGCSPGPRLRSVARSGPPPVIAPPVIAPPIPPRSPRRRFWNGAEPELGYSLASSAARSSRPSEPCDRADMCQALRSNAAPRACSAADRPSSQARSPSL